MVERIVNRRHVRLELRQRLFGDLNPRSDVIEQLHEVLDVARNFR